MKTPLTAPQIIDLRSDTVTRPTPEMYAAMQAAPVGDDVLGDDPTVIRLEELAAERVGKEAAVFVASGTMGNQIALACHTHPGDGILIEEEAHILYYEVGAPGVISGVVSWTLPSHLGIIDPNVVESHVTKRSIHTPGTVLLCLENTHNRAGGTVIPISTMRDYRTIANKHGMHIHLDGARVFNAAVKLGVPVNEITQYVDSVNFCLSKGLRSPVGSVLCGSKEFIDKARIWRKRLGGGMRQSGILAACGIVSLTQYVDRLADDHRRTSHFANSIADLKGVYVEMESVQTNMCYVGLDRPATEWVSRLADENVWLMSTGPNRIRVVFHADVDDQATEMAIQAFKRIAQEGA
jgi:threonine aldolase